MRRRTSPTAIFLAGTLATVVAALAPPAASAHPLGNVTVNRAVAITVSDRVELLAVLDMAEIPAYEVIRELDRDGDDAVTDAEGAEWADATCTAWREAIDITVDDRPVAPEPIGPPALTFPAGAGGLPTLRLECPSAVAVEDGGGGESHRLSVRDRSVDERAGWREMTASAQGSAQMVASDVRADSPTALLTVYPEDQLEAPPDIRTATVTFVLGADGSVLPARTGGDEGGGRASSDPLAALVGGDLSPAVIALAFLLSIGLGAAHALSPGHGKALVAAYVLGAGGSARSAMSIGLWVAVSHTAGVFALGVVTLLASEFLVPERLIGWLSLGSGIVVIGLGLVLLARVLRGRQRATAHERAHEHGDDHGHPQGHGHGHSHDVPASGELSWRTAVALGFAGGAVPSASALIVLLVAISTDRLLLGSLLIGSFGIGMAAVLGGLAFAVARLRRSAAHRDGLTTRPIVRRAETLAPLAAGVVVLGTGIAFTAAAVAQLA